MGGDRGPDEIVAGALEATSSLDSADPVRPAGLDTKGLELVEAADTIGMHEKPVEAVRAKPDSSLVVACRAVGDGDADAVVSAGNTGAMLAASLFYVRRLTRSGPAGDRRRAYRPGTVRPSSSTRAQTLTRGPEHLLQFALMGSIFAEELLEIANPEVRLLSIGEEPEKGNQLTLEAHALLAASDLRFGGNIESRHLLSNAGEVVVCDGFTGNICLKLLEGTIKTLLEGLRDEIRASTRGKIGGLLIRPAARQLRERLDPDTYGGAYLLGLRGLAVIAHGNSSRTAIANAIRLAARGVEHRLVERLSERLGTTVLASARSEVAEPG